MRQSNISRLFDILKDLDRRQAIPSSDLATFEERFILTFTSPSPLKPIHGRSRKEYKVRYAEKKAQQVYSNILEEFPHLYIPFVLAFSPKACEKFDDGKFCDDDEINLKLTLGNDSRTFLFEIAEKNGFHENSLFLGLIESLYPEERIPKPKAIGKNENYYIFNGANWKNINAVFSENVCAFIKKSPRRVRELYDLNLQEITHCVTMKIPRQNYEDAILSLEVCIDKENQLFFKNLFEPSWKRTRNDVISILDKASVPTIPKISSQINFAVNESELRKWEKAYTYKHTTGCLFMEIHTRHGYGILHMRIGFVVSTHIARKLYGFN